jgi:hypothetical protein
LLLELLAAERQPQMKAIPANTNIRIGPVKVILFICFLRQAAIAYQSIRKPLMGSRDFADCSRKTAD